MIQGVETKKLRVIPDERGWLMEILRNDDSLFVRFGQVYVTMAYPGMIKAWHYHKVQTDFITVVRGMAKLVLFDNRKDSSTYKEINEYFAGEKNPILVKVPPLVWHGFCAIGGKEALMLNCPTEVYKYDAPDEYREDPFTDKVPYDWKPKHG